MAILVSSALVFGSVATNGVSARITRNAEQADLMQASAPMNHSPLTTGGAAGIKQEQAMEISPLPAIGIVAGIFALGVLLIGDGTDDDEVVPTTNSTF